MQIFIFQQLESNMAAFSEMYLTSLERCCTDAI